MAGNKGRREAALLVAAVLAAASGLGVLTATRPGAAAAVAAGVLLSAALLGLMRPRPAPTGLGDKSFKWVSFAWAFLMIRPIGHFTGGRSTLDAVGGVPSVERVLDLGIH